MLWVAGAVNATFLIATLAAWPLASARLDSNSRGRPIAYFLSALLAFNLAWILWNHLQMAHQLVSVRPFITTTGIAEIVSIPLAALLVWFAGVGIFGSRRPAPRLVSLAGGIAIAAVLVALDSREAAQHRVFTHSEILAGAGKPSQSGIVGLPPQSKGPLILIGIDGLSWSVAHPLMQQGKLPALAGLVASGMSGYLNNGDQSYSPPIWMTIFTGHAKEIHGVHGYRRLIINASGRSVPNLRLFGNHFDIFYGLNHLVQKLPNLGLWSITTVSSHDRRVPAIWDVVGTYRRRIAVVNPMASLPFSPVNGAIVSLGHSWKRGATAYQPESLAAKWGKEPLAEAIPNSDEIFEAHAERLSEEIDFTLKLFREQQIDLGIFYTHFIDTVSHFNWDFYARDKTYLADLPRTLSDDQWARRIEKNQEDRAFRCYVIIDQQRRRFLDAFPDAIFIIVSDHGWTYSGYEHFGSPDGVIIAAGPGVRRGGEIVHASIEDIAPTLLSRLGIPLSRELTGKVLDEIFEEPIDSGWVASYDNSLVTPPSSGLIDVLDDEDAERLRAIGYID